MEERRRREGVPRDWPLSWAGVEQARSIRCDIFAAEGDLITPRDTRPKMSTGCHELWVSWIFVCRDSRSGSSKPAYAKYVPTGFSHVTGTARGFFLVRTMPSGGENVQRFDRVSSSLGPRAFSCLSTGCAENLSNCLLKSDYWTCLCTLFCTFRLKSDRMSFNPLRTRNICET